MTRIDTTPKTCLPHDDAENFAAELNAGEPRRIVTAALMRQSRASTEQSLCLDETFPSWEQLVPPDEAAEAGAELAFVCDARYMADIARAATIIGNSHQPALKFAHIQGPGKPGHFDVRGDFATAQIVLMPLSTTAD